VKRPLWVNLGLALAVAVLAWLVFLKPEASPDSASYKLSPLNATQVDEISIALAHQPQVVLRKKPNGWSVTEPFSARADALRVDSLLGLLSAQSEKRLAAQDLARFELDKPLARVKLGAQEFVFGATQPLTNQLYVLTQGAVYLISPVYFIDVAKPAQTLISKQLLADAEVPVAFEFPHFTLKRENGTWGMTPQTDAPSQDNANAFADEWRHALALAVSRENDFKASEHITLRFASGKSLTLQAKQQAQEWVVLREDEKLAYHFTMGAAQRLREPWSATKK
jgi:hypothetical protein